MEQKIPLVAVVGRPNVGKSSLFNRLGGSRQAIVAREAGTTRDATQRLITIGKRSFWLVDTAGLYGDTPISTPAQIAKTVSAQVDDAIAAADVILIVFDAAVPITQPDRRLLRVLYKSNKPILGVVNKIDKTAQTIPNEFTKLGNITAIGTSTTTGTGISELRQQIVKLLPPSHYQPDSALPIAIVGRPNVGKSSLFNRLVGQAKAAVSATPHTTRDANLVHFKSGSQNFALLDTAGIRKPGKRAEIEAFSYLRTIQAINQSEIVILVIDGLEPSVKTDQAIAGLVKDAGKGLIVAINKWDLIEDKDTSRLRVENLLQSDFAFVWWAPIVFISAQKGTNTTRLLPLALSIAKLRDSNFPPAQLQTIIAEAVANHQPPYGPPRVKIGAISQSGGRPPAFTITGKNLDKLHWSYRRYLEAQLRAHLNLMGTPIKIKLK